MYILKTYQKRIEKWMKDQSTKTKCYINAMVEQLEVGNDLKEMLLQRALIPHYANYVNALECHLRSNARDMQ